MNRSSFHLLEASWEVCNKVGGIHTVIVSKLPHALKEFGSNYLPIGPYLPTSNQPFAEEALPQEWHELAQELGQKGIVLHYGHWLIDGQPPVVLVDWTGLQNGWNEQKAYFWHHFALDSLGSDFFDFDTPLQWSYACGLFARAYAKLHPSDSVAIHGHEWMTGGIFLAMEDEHLPNLRNVFTTHATVLGRALSSKSLDIEAQMEVSSPEELARLHGVISKHQLECLSARLATVFTTVSHITSEEADLLLGRKPDLVTENGLNFEDFPDFAELAHTRPAIRQLFDQFCAAFFFPAGTFDLKKSSYHFTMGRYEMHNKGYDLHIEALGKLNRKLQEESSEETIVTFFMVPAQHFGLAPEYQHRLITNQHLLYLTGKAAREMQNAWFTNAWKGEHTNVAEMPPQIAQETATILAATSGHDPANPYSPYQLLPEAKEAFTNLFRQAELHNRPQDRVKVVFLPVYFDGYDGIFNLPLYSLIPAFDLGVFASYYEPWGYTPMESMALGVPAITSTLAGYGRALKQQNKHISLGYWLLNRDDHDDEQATEMLEKYLAAALAENSRDRLVRRMDAYRTAQHFDWKQLYNTYLQAYSHCTT